MIKQFNNLYVFLASKLTEDLTLNMITTIPINRIKPFEANSFCRKLLNTTLYLSIMRTKSKSKIKSSTNNYYFLQFLRIFFAANSLFKLMQNNIFLTHSYF
jgi:hypothetical protein